MNHRFSTVGASGGGVINCINIKHDTDSRTTLNTYGLPNSVLIGGSLMLKPVALYSYTPTGASNDANVVHKIVITQSHQINNHINLPVHSNTPDGNYGF